MNQLTKFTFALSLTACFLFPLPAFSVDTESICIIEVPFESKSVTTYRAICCPGDEQFTFQGLPGLETGTGCSGSHCHKMIKIAIETEIETLIKAVANSGETEELEKDVESLAAISRQIKSGKSMTDEQVKRVEKILAKHHLKLTSGIQRPNSPIITSKPDPRDPENKRIIIQGFEPDLERFGYDDDAMDPMSDDDIKGCLREKAKFTKCCFAKFKHPKSQRQVIVQIVLCESDGHDVPGDTGTYLKKEMHAFGFEINKLPDGLKPADVYDLEAVDVFLPKDCDRHCLMVQLGNVIAGVTLAEHRLGKFTKE